MPRVSTVSISEAKIHLSRLVKQAACGQEVVIAKAGKPMVRLVPFHATNTRRNLGGLAGKVTIPDDIKKPFAEDVAAMFNASL
jgi:prevent-host-death family protein